MPLQQGAQPLYHRVYREIAEGIESGVLQPGDRLPSERALCEQLGVSRATVRRAVEELISDGLVETRGRGSFVRGDAVVEPPNTLMSLSEVARQRGLGASSRVLRADVRPATIDEAEAFGDRARRRPVRARAGADARRAADLARPEPRAAPAAAGRGRHRLRRGVALRRARGRGASARRARTTSWRRARAAPHEADLLGLAPDAPVLFATTVAIGDDGRVVDLGRTVYRADRYRFQATLMRRAHRYGGRQ